MVRSKCGYCQCEPDPPGEPEQLPSLRLADEREPSENDEHGRSRRSRFSTSLRSNGRIAGGHRALGSARHVLFLATRHADAICLDRANAARSRPDEAVRPRGARDSRRLVPDRDAASGPAALRQGPAGNGEHRRRHRDRRREPDSSPRPAARGTPGRSPRATSPRHRRTADRGRIGGYVHVRRHARPACASAPRDRNRRRHGLRGSGDGGHRRRAGGATRRGRQSLLARSLGRARHRPRRRRGDPQPREL